MSKKKINKIKENKENQKLYKTFAFALPYKTGGMV